LQNKFLVNPADTLIDIILYIYSIIDGCQFILIPAVLPNGAAQQAQNGMRKIL